MIETYIGIGSNLADPRAQVSSALQELSMLQNTQLVKCSSLYASRPMGPQDQPPYVNGVVKLHTGLSPLALLDECQDIEQRHGRQRKDNRWGPRTLDLDILLYAQQTINLPDLVVPHYGMREREFVLYPLFEIAPGLVLPCGTTLASLRDDCPLNGLTLLTAVSQ
ncbi:MAG: 2-amino-4-hydroxy-6-hydroxymethyldihydropteridine diphosphokinase [Paraglaciecola sp.]|jgi:2-amino-4-hydroxy-6-hydroxymethyldihydropteridine diphosphokinase